MRPPLVYHNVALQDQLPLLLLKCMERDVVMVKRLNPWPLYTVVKKATSTRHHKELACLNVHVRDVAITIAVMSLTISCTEHGLNSINSKILI